MQKPKLLLLDANVIIEAHLLEIWDALKTAYDIAVPSIVVSEARYFESSSGRSSGINLKKEIDAAEIRAFEGTVEEIQKAFASINDVFLKGIDPGEQEAIALIAAGRCDGYSFCTGDINAIQAMALLNLEDRSVAFETIVNDLKFTAKIRVEPYLTEKTLHHHLRAGRELRTSGVYDRPAPKTKKRRN